MSPKKKAEKLDAGSKEEGFSDEELSAMKERAAELKTEKGRGRSDRRAKGEKELLAKIDEMPEPDHALATRFHAIVEATAPNLEPKTWYGMPAYAKDGKVVCFFQGAAKYNTRYATLGFTDSANLDDGNMWVTSFAVTALGPAEEEKIRGAVKKAAS